MKFSPQQDQALKAVSQWLSAYTPQSEQQVFRLFGYAGTGKSTLSQYVAQGIEGGVCFAAFTGKAAQVMRSKGCKGASTIHALIYHFVDQKGGEPRFELNPESEIKDARLVIIDECSMVGEELARDLLSFKKPVLVLGDPAQLPPVKGAGVFTNAKPDILLTEIHRQARDNPIIDLAMRVRMGGDLERGTYGDSRVLGKADITSEDILNADQILVGMNKTRHQYNTRIRELRGLAADKVEVGEKLVCLRNDHRKRLLNGSLWYVKKAMGRKDKFHLSVMPEWYPGKPYDVKAKVFREFFEGREDELDWRKKAGTQEFTYGYALTVHKAQGSQWDHVVLFDQSGAFRDDARRWLYTGITRAAKSLTLVMP